MPDGADMSVETARPPQENVQDTPTVDTQSRRDLLRAGVGAGILAGLRALGGDLSVRHPDSRIHLTEAFLQKKYDIGFEPGDHDFRINAELETDQGATDAFRWNPQVLQRLQQYDPRPKVLTIDGLGTNMGENYDFWSMLPGKPSDIHESGAIYVVASEQLVTRSSAFTGTVDRDIQDALEKNFREDRDSFHENNDRKAMEDIRKVLLAAGGVQLARTFYESFAQQPDDKEVRADTTAADKAKSGISRRRILGIGLLGAGALATDEIGRRVSKSRLSRILGASNATTQDRKNSQIREIDLLSPRGIVYDDWLNARNAMYILKTKDSMDFLEKSGKITPQEKAAIIAGNAHSVGMNRLMGNDRACVEALRKYAGELFRIIDKCAEANAHLNPGDIKGNLIKIMSETDIHEVRDLADEPNVAKRLNDAFVYRAGGVSPRVFDALSPLVPNADRSEVGLTYDLAALKARKDRDHAKLVEDIQRRHPPVANVGPASQDG
jgi:hypothetical protein